MLVPSVDEVCVGSVGSYGGGDVGNGIGPVICSPAGQEGLCLSLY